MEKATKCVQNAMFGMNIVNMLLDMSNAQSINDTFHFIMFMPRYAYMIALKPMAGVNTRKVAKIAANHAFNISLGDGLIRAMHNAFAAKWNMFA